mmetsp:Transcript_868/g.2136  ORF Transcript_868/g.2136 Transcript_868/m.2136 type:complete len:347 (-) Transcript_868:291-1331(-)
MAGVGHLAKDVLGLEVDQVWPQQARVDVLGVRAWIVPPADVYAGLGGGHVDKRLVKGEHVGLEDELQKLIVCHAVIAGVAPHGQVRRIHLEHDTRGGNSLVFRPERLRKGVDVRGVVTVVLVGAEEGDGAGGWHRPEARAGRKPLRRGSGHQRREVGLAELCAIVDIHRRTHACQLGASRRVLVEGDEPIDACEALAVLRGIIHVGGHGHVHHGAISVHSVDAGQHVADVVGASHLAIIHDVYASLPLHAHHFIQGSPLAAGEGPNVGALDPLTLACAGRRGEGMGHCPGSSGGVRAAGRARRGDAGREGGDRLQGGILQYGLGARQAKSSGQCRYPEGVHTKVEH